MIEIPAIWAFVALVLHVMAVVAYVSLFFFFVLVGGWLVASIIGGIVSAIKNSL